VLSWTLRKLRSADASERRAAAEALAKSRDDRAIQSLVIATLFDPDGSVRDTAARSLGAMGGERGMQMLIGTAVQFPSENRHENEIARHAARALRLIGDPRGVFVLISALIVDDYNVHFRACDIWSALGDDPWITNTAKHALNELATAIVTQPNSSIRLRAVWVVGRIRDNGAVPLLIRALADENQLVRVMALDGLENIGGPLDSRDLGAVLKTLEDSSVEVRRAAVVCCAIRDPRALPALQRCLADSEEQVRLSAVDAIAAVSGPESTALLVLALRDRSARVRKRALKGLEERSWIPPFNEDGAWWFVARGTAENWPHIMTLGTIAIPALSSVLAPETHDGRDAVSAASALARLDARVAEGDLKLALADSKREVRAAAIDALFELFGDRAIEIIASGPAPLSDDVISRLEVLGKKSVPAFVKSLGVRNRGIAPALRRLGWNPEVASDSARLLVAEGRYAEAAEIGSAAAGPLIEAILARVDTTGLRVDGEGPHLSVDYQPRDALTRVLERCASSVDVDVLASIAKLESFTLNFTAYGNCSYTEERKQSVDFILIRQLARQELIRRGLPA
jgi:HEAT repeat protein